MVVKQPPVWICILFTLIETVCFGKAQGAQVFRASACFESRTCPFYGMNCSGRGVIEVKKLQYGIRGSTEQNCQNVDECVTGETFCCSDMQGDCLKDFNEKDALYVMENCSGVPFCGPFRAVQGRIDKPHTCDGIYSQYVVIYYTCLQGPSTTKPGPITTARNIVTSTSSLSTRRVSSTDKQTSLGLTSTSLKDGEEHHERLIISLVVVVAVLVLFAMLVIVFILHRRRCKKSSKEDAPKNQLPDVLINHSDITFGGSNQDYKAVESANYVEMNDKSIATYSRPVKKKENCSTIAKDEKKTGRNCATDEYDKIEFENKCAVKMTNYDCVSAKKVKKLDDTYSHVSGQSKPASAGAANDYSHCQFIRHESRSNDDTNKTAVSNENLVADNYSHVDLNAEKTKRRPSHIIEEDSYTHIELDKSTNPPRNGHALSVRTIPKSEEGSQTFKDLQSLAVEGEGWPICDRNFGVSLQDPPLQDIKAVSLPDNYIEFKFGDIYDTPRCKDQQYNVVLKGNKEQLFNRIEIESKRKSLTQENAEDCAVRSDYELAKPIDL